MRDMSKMKRIFDVVLSLVLGLVLVPVIIGVVIAIKVTSPGPVIFRQKRLGLNGQVFLMNKFRKFPSDWGTGGPSLTLQFDSRMTGIGRILERTKLDEVPQLWNIFVGEMSFVGPRPAPVSFKPMFTGRYEDILKYKPGIFGPNQTKYRNESALYPPDEDPMTFYKRVLFPDKASRDLEYFSRATMNSDLFWIGSGAVSLLGSVVIWRSSAKVSLILMLWDVLSIVAGWLAAFFLKYSVVYPEFSNLMYVPTVMKPFKFGLVAAPLVLLIVFMVFRIYRHPIRHFSFADAQRLVGANAVVWILTAIAFGVLLNSSSTMVLAVAWLGSTLMMLIPRVLWQQIHSRHVGVIQNKSDSATTNIVVCGVDHQTLDLCTLLSRGFKKVNLVGLISENRDLQGREVRGFKVVGSYSELEVLQLRYNFDQVWIGSGCDQTNKEKIFAWCTETTIELIFLDRLDGFSRLISDEEKPVFNVEEGGKTSEALAVKNINEENKDITAQIV